MRAGSKGQLHACFSIFHARLCGGLRQRYRELFQATDSMATFAFAGRSLTAVTKARPCPAVEHLQSLTAHVCVHPLRRYSTRSDLPRSCTHGMLVVLLPSMACAHPPEPGGFSTNYLPFLCEEGISSPFLFPALSWQYRP
jgi:hypothetical protein